MTGGYRLQSYVRHCIAGCNNADGLFRHMVIGYNDLWFTHGAVNRLC
jgi:hypothetical protein